MRKLLPALQGHTCCSLGPYLSPRLDPNDQRNPNIARGQNGLLCSFRKGPHALVQGPNHVLSVFA